MRTLLTTLLAASLALGACSSQTPVSDAVRARAKAGGQFALAEVTAFRWDTVHIFGPYSSQERVCQALTVVWPDCKKHVPRDGVPEGAFLTVFALGNQTLHHELHPRRNGEYCPDSCAIVLNAKEAVFAVVAASATGAHSKLVRVVRSAA
jgi:hypothetical protein